MNARPPASAGFAEDEEILVQGQVEVGGFPETQVFQIEQKIPGADAADRETASHARAVAEHVQAAVADFVDRLGTDRRLAAEARGPAQPYAAGALPRVPPATKSETASSSTTAALTAKPDFPGKYQRDQGQPGRTGKPCGSRK